ncbi:MAG: response regulator [Saprospiraceae bacterium]|nr:response regulator [Saprospiraceae bacterium]
MTSDKKRQILVVDDEHDDEGRSPFCHNLFAASPEWAPVFAKDETETQQMLVACQSTLDLVLLDLSLNGESYEQGLELLSTIVQFLNKQIPVVVVTRDDTPSTYRKALDAGAAGYLLKASYELNNWRQEIEDILQWYDPAMILNDASVVPHYPPLLAVEEALAEKCQQYGINNFSAIVQGEPGVGKYHLKGFFKEIPEIFPEHDLHSQINILQKIHEAFPVTLFARKRLSELFRTNKILASLYELLQPHVLDIPPLREQKQFILPLMDHFLAQPSVCPVHKTNFFARAARDVFDQDAIRLLQEYEWDRNIRELREVMQSAIYDADLEGQIHILPHHLPHRIRKTIRFQKEPRLREYRAYQKLIEIQRALIHNGSNKQDIATSLGITLQALNQLVKQYHIEYPHLFNQQTETICKFFNHLPGFSKPIDVTVWYALESQEICHKLITQISPLLEAYPLRIRTNNTLGPGSIQDEVLSNYLKASDMTILLVCPNFLISKDYREHIFDFIIQYKHSGQAASQPQETTIIPVIAKPCLLRGTPIEGLTLLPRGEKGKEKSIVESENIDAVIAGIAEEIVAHFDHFKSHP